MAHVLFILGAGASAHGGCPVMSTFLETARRIAVDGPSDGFAKIYEGVHQVRRVLQRANSKSVLDFDNIETLFCSIEMAEILGGIGEWEPAALGRAKENLLRLIAQTLDKTQAIHLRWISAPDLRISAGGPADYTILAEFIGGLMGCKYHHKVSIITFNYDLGLELALNLRNISYSYGLEETENDLGGSEEIVRVFKLHGSLNWVDAGDASTGVVIKTYDPVEELRIQASRNAPQIWHLDSSHGRGKILGRHPDASLPFIVPPGDAKSVYRVAMRRVWRQACQSLQAAEVIAAYGYSLPPTDTFFSHLFSLGMISDTVVRHVRIANTNSDAADRIARLLGPVVQKAHILRTNIQPMHVSVSEWRHEIASMDFYL